MRSANPRVVTTGGKFPSTENTESLAHIDWLAFTVKPSETWGESEREQLDYFWPLLNRYFSVPGMRQIDRLGKWNGYDRVFELDGHGLLGIGGRDQKGTIHVSLPGAACAHISDWQATQSFLESVNARITRADLAHDDFDGKSLNMEAAVQWYHDGLFKAGGRNPKHRIEGDWLDPGSPKGRSLYIGRKAYGKLSCIYEKGKQLGDPLSPWTRAEVRFGNKSRLIPLDVLTRPSPYLAGAYPAFSYLSAIQDKIRTVSKVTEMTLAAAIHHTRLTGGKVINLLRTLYDGDDAKVVAALRRDGIPKRLEHYADFIPALEGVGE